MGLKPLAVRRPFAIRRKPLVAGGWWLVAGGWWLAKPLRGFAYKVAAVTRTVHCASPPARATAYP
jgi:hypothetical protein